MTSDPDTSDEVVDGLPVLAGEAPSTALDIVRPAQVPAVQAAALAATGFVAGVATVAVFGRRRRRLVARRRRRQKGAIGEIVSSSSFLVDVHVLRR